MTPLRVHTIVISTQHDDGVSNEQIAKDLMEHGQSSTQGHCWSNAFCLLAAPGLSMVFLSLTFLFGFVFS